MKKIFAIILCVCIALSLSLSAMAASSAETKVIIRKATSTKNDGSNIPADTFVEVSEDSTITVTANEKVYGKFNKWTIYVVKSVSGTDQVEYVAAKEGVDYTVVSGSLEDGTLVIKPISQIAVAGNYDNKITDPAQISSTPGTTPTSPKGGDVSVMFAVVTLLAAGAVLFGAKRQLSK